MADQYGITALRIKPAVGLCDEFKARESSPRREGEGFRKNLACCCYKADVPSVNHLLDTHYQLQGKSRRSGHVTEGYLNHIYCNKNNDRRKVESTHRRQH